MNGRWPLMKQFKFRVNELSEPKCMDMQLLQVGIGGFLGCLALSRLMMSRLCDQRDYEEIVNMPDDDQRDVYKQLYQALNEASIWTTHSKN